MQTEETQIEQQATAKDYFIFGNESGLVWNNPELYGAKADTSWDLSKHTDLTKDLKPDEFFSVLDSRSEEDFTNRLSRLKIYNESANKVMMEENPFKKYGGVAAASMISPLTAVPIAGAVGKANQILKATSTLGRMATTGIATGTAGALGNVASEAVFAQQGLPHDYTTGAMFGFVLGGGIGSIAEGISRTLYKSKLASSLTTKDDVEAFDTAPVDVEYTADMVDGDTPRVTRIANIDAAYSAIGIAYSSINKQVRNLIGKMAPPSSGLNGKVVSGTMRDDIVQLKGNLHNTMMDIGLSYRDAVTDGRFKGSYDDYLEDVGKRFSELEASQDIKVKSDVEYNEALKELRKLRKQIKQDTKKKVAEQEATTKEFTSKGIIDEGEVEETFVYGKDTPEYKEAYEDYLTRPDTEVTPVTVEELKAVEFPKGEGFGSPKPKFYSRPIEFKDNITKSIYVAAGDSKGKTSQQHMAWLEKEFGLSYADARKIRDSILADVKADKPLKGIEEYIGVIDINTLKKPSKGFEAPTGTRKVRATRPMTSEEKLALKQGSKEEVKKLEEERIKQLEEAEAKFDELVNNLYIKHMPKLDKDLTIVNKYFKDMLKRGKEENIPSLKRLSDNRLYMPRQIDYAKVKTMDTNILIEKLYRGFRNHPSNSKISDVDLRKMSEDFANELKVKGFDTDFNDFSYFAKDTLGVDSRLKNRKIHIDNSQISDILKVNVNDVMGGYGYWMNGQFAVRKAFPELRGIELDKTMDVFREKYVNPVKASIKDEREAKDLVAVDEVLQDLLGLTRARNTNTTGMFAARMVTQANAAALSGMMGLIQLLEIPTALWATGFNRLFHKQFGSMFAELNKALFKEGTTNNPFLRELVNLGYLNSLQEVQGINRIAETETVFNMNKIEHGLNKLNGKIFKYNGMRAITSWLESIVASNAVTKIVNTTFSDADMKYFARWGLSADDVRGLQKELKAVGDIREDGTIIKMGIENMTPEGKEKISRAVARAIESGVIQGDTMYLPTWMIIPSPMKKIMTQFMRFPIAANEVLLRRGVNEDLAGWAASVAGSYMIGMAMFKLIEDAEIALGLREKYQARYDLDTEEGLYNLVLKATTYNASFGAFTLGVDTGLGLLGQPQLGRDFANRDVAGSLLNATGGRIQATSNFARAMLEGKFDDERAWKGMTTFWLPMNGFPILGRGIDELVEMNTIKY